MNLHLSSIAALALAAGTAAAAGPAATGARAGAAIPVDGVAAQVNGRRVTVAAVTAAMQPVARQLKATLKGAELDRRLAEAYDKTLQSLIERELILDAFERQKEMALPDSIIQARTEEIVRNEFGNSRAAFRKALDAEGLTLDEWQANLKHTLIVSILRDREVTRKVSVSPSDVRAAYENALDTFRVPEQARVSLILIRGGASHEDAAVKRRQAEAVRARLAAGEAFDSLARQVSEGPQAEAGGDLGWIEPDSRRPELAAAIRALTPGGLSPVVEAGGDLYILTVHERREARLIPFESVQATLRAELEKQQAKDLYDAWIARLADKAFIKKY